MISPAVLFLFSVAQKVVVGLTIDAFAFFWFCYRIVVFAFFKLLRDNLSLSCVRVAPLAPAALESRYPNCLVSLLPFCCVAHT